MQSWKKDREKETKSFNNENYEWGCSGKFLRHSRRSSLISLAQPICTRAVERYWEYTWPSGCVRSAFGGTVEFDVLRWLSLSCWITSCANRCEKQVLLRWQKIDHHNIIGRLLWLPVPWREVNISRRLKL